MIKITISSLRLDSIELWQGFGAKKLPAWLIDSSCPNLLSVRIQEKIHHPLRWRHGNTEKKAECCGYLSCGVPHLKSPQPVLE
jgi:hypothetical protein